MYMHKHIAENDAKYNSPSNPKLLFANLQNIYKTTFGNQERVHNSPVPNSLAVNDWEMLFAPVSKKIIKLRKMSNTTKEVTMAQQEDFMIIAKN